MKLVALILNLLIPTTLGFVLSPHHGSSRSLSKERIIVKSSPDDIDSLRKMLQEEGSEWIPDDEDLKILLETKKNKDNMVDPPEQLINVFGKMVKEGIANEDDFMATCCEELKNNEPEDVLDKADEWFAEMDSIHPMAAKLWTSLFMLDPEYTKKSIKKMRDNPDKVRKIIDAMTPENMMACVKENLSWW